MDQGAANFARVGEEGFLLRVIFQLIFEAQGHFVLDVIHVRCVRVGKAEVADRPFEIAAPSLRMARGTPVRTRAFSSSSFTTSLLESPPVRSR